MRKLLVTSCFILIFTATSGCSEKNEAHYTYLDGSGNKYILSPDGILEYDPVRIEESSSGEYSGGEPVSKKVEPVVLDNIRTTFKTAIENKDIHIEKRVKLSGLIEVRGGKQKNIYILNPSSPKKDEIEQLLKSAISQ